ncbi:MAG: hypothetical protein ABH826_04875 [Patescibacteria group bacterium]
MKKILTFLIINAILVAGNIYAWLLTLKVDYQLAWVAFVIVLVNIILSLLVLSRQKTIMYFFATSSLIIELLLIINYFWIQGRGLVL